MNAAAKTTALSATANPSTRTDRECAALGAVVLGTGALTVTEPLPTAPLTEMLELVDVGRPAEELVDRLVGKLVDGLELGAVALETGELETGELEETDGNGNDEPEETTERGKERELWLGLGGPSVGITVGNDSVWAAVKGAKAKASARTVEYFMDKTQDKLAAGEMCVN
ncbi:hypothetical protein DFH09DRAFT_1122053 [Mycena vulgaris]|nr:hypothetical protein DFH09DRAFT_1122053 [Mycena vulgaris]